MLIALLANSPTAWPATQAQIIQSCETCHGPGGDSRTATTPRLNGQQPEYILYRLKEFSGMARNNPHADIDMFKILLAESDTDKAMLAAYFARQPPAEPRPGARAAEGKRIFDNGLTAENVVACNLCHGANGEGHNLAPRLAGQHADYLKAQLLLFHLKYREHYRAHPNPTAQGPTGPATQQFPMNANTEAMTQGTMDALASYLAND